MTASRRAARGAGIAALALLLVACGGPAPSPSSTSAPDAAGPAPQLSAIEPQYNPQPYDNIADGGSLTTSLPEISPQFNVFQGDSTIYSQAVWSWYNPVLATYSPTGEVTFNPDYLTDVQQTVVDGNTRVTYTINPQAVYNDGASIDWTSFEATWKANNAADPAYLVSSSDGYSNISSVVAGVNARQAVVTFAGTNIWWQVLFNNLLNPKALDAGTYNEGYLDNPHPEWGAGPYTLSTFDKGNGSVSFERNPRWWGARGKLDVRTFVAQETSARVNAFKNGELDAASVAARDQLAAVEGMSGIEIRKSISTRVSLFTLNGTSPILSDVRVRKAVLQGIDRGQIEKIFFQGLDFSAPPPGSLNLLPFQAGYQDSFSKVLTFDVDQARKDLDAAGWAVGTDGIRAKDGRPLEFTYVFAGDDVAYEATASSIVAMMRDIGVRLVIRQVPSSEFSTLTSGREFDMTFSGITSTDPFGMAYICQVYCSDSELNMSGTGRPELDQEIKSVNLLPTAEQQFSRGNEVEIEALQTYGVMPVLNPVQIVAVKSGLANYGAGLFFTALPQNVGFQK